MRRKITYPHNWVVVKAKDNKQYNLGFGFQNPVDLMSCSNEEFSLPNIDQGFKIRPDRPDRRPPVPVYRTG